MIDETADGLILTIVAQPKSSKNEVIGPYNGAIKIKIMAPPMEGRANEALVEFLSEILDIPRKNISLIKGKTSKYKRFHIVGCDKEILKQKMRVSSED